MSSNLRRLVPHTGWSAIAVVACVLSAAPSALASDAFTDVPNGAPFHNEISIFKATNITTGCTITAFCPTDTVKRQAMAAFIDRALGLVVRPGELTYKAVPGSLASAIDDDQSFVGTSGSALRLHGPNDNVVVGASNSVRSGAQGATVAGGGSAFLFNLAAQSYVTVGGGLGNTAGDAAGAAENSSYATVGGGQYNTASKPYAFIGGGNKNTAGFQAVVAGGESNTASGYDATVGGGESNTASSQHSTVPGGLKNTASGFSSFAAGARANAIHPGSFVWADSASSSTLDSVGNNSFTARAVGGFYLRTDTALTTGCDLGAGSGSWSCSSDRNLKEHLRAVDREKLLGRLAGIPISTWNYKSESASIRHVGPMAQDFAKAFRVGEDNRHISMVDADGVALAAIQGLYAENRALKRRLARVEATLTSLSRKDRR